jgi:phage recombination protein Bet
MSNALTLFEGLASSAGLSESQYLATIKATVFPNKGAGATDAQLAAFLMVAKQYSLNPLTKEIFAFPANGGIQPVVSIDGWMKLINSHPEFDGMTFADTLDEAANIVAVTCRIHRKDRNHPIEATEYMVECKRETAVWKQWPRRMLRHKAAIQAARYAFGFAGIVDPDEAERGQAVYAEVVDDVQEVPQALIKTAEAAAAKGSDRLSAYWKEIGKESRILLASRLESFKVTAAQADERLTNEAIARETAEAAA